MLFYGYLDFDHCEMFAEDVALFDYHFIRAVVTEEGSCAPEIFHIYFYGFILFYLKVEIYQVFIVEFQ